MRASRFWGGGAVLATLILAPGLALADLTAEDVWAELQRMARENGGELTATLERAPGRIVLRDATSRVPSRDMTTRLSEVTLVEEAGEVAVLMPAQTITLSGTAREGQTVRMEVRFVPRDFAFRLSGTPEDISFTQTASMLSFDCENFLMDGQPVDATMNCAANVAMLDWQSRRLTQGDRREVTQSLRVGRLAASLSTGPKGEEAAMGAGFVADDLATTSHGRYPVAWSDPNQILREAEEEATITFGALEASINRLDQRLSLRATGGETTIDGRDARADIRSRLDGGAVTFSAFGLSDAPGFGFATLATTIEGPLLETDAAQPFRLFLDAGDVTLNDAAWGLFDPGAVLPRDPGQVTLALSGQIRVIGTAGDARSADLEAANVETLLLRIAGAELSGTGAFTFPEGAEHPAGTADLLLTGGEQLLDGLVRIGIVPQGQAMMVRMMAGGFSQPGDGPDTLTSHVEFRPDGSILANGRPLR